MFILLLQAKPLSAKKKESKLSLLFKGTDKKEVPGLSASGHVRSESGGSSNRGINRSASLSKLPSPKAKTEPTEKVGSARDAPLPSIRETQGDGDDRKDSGPAGPKLKHGP